MAEALQSGAAGIDEPLHPPADPVAGFVEQMGLLCEAEQMPRIAGRLFGLFLVEEGAFNIRELAQKLNVSRASVSTNARMLAAAGILQRVAMAGDRQDYYELSARPYHQMLSVMIQRLDLAQQAISKAAESFPPERAAAKGRVCGLAEFYRATISTFSGLVQTLAKRSR